jgi:hypothetical protein
VLIAKDVAREKKKLKALTGTEAIDASGEKT